MKIGNFLLPLLIASSTSLAISQEEVKAANVTKDSNKQAEEKEESIFLRLSEVGGQPQALETAIVTFQSPSPSGVQVDLIGAVHIGESRYYQQLNQQFDQYEVLLYELVAPEGTKIPFGARRESTSNPISMLQDTAKNMLGLESQLELIDYTKSHFVRADLTPTQIFQKMEERGDTVFTLALSTLADAMREQNKLAAKGEPSPIEDLSLADLLGNPLKLKRALATQFASSGSLDQALGGSLNQLLIVDRNAAAIKELQKQIAAGKRKIGIFYGAAHLPDFEQQLVKDFGLTKTATVWLDAWDLTQAKEPELSEPMSLFLNLLENLE